MHRVGKKVMVGFQGEEQALESRFYAVVQLEGIAQTSLYGWKPDKGSPDRHVASLWFASPLLSHLGTQAK